MRLLGKERFTENKYTITRNVHYKFHFISFILTIDHQIAFLLLKPLDYTFVMSTSKYLKILLDVLLCNHTVYANGNSYIAHF